MGCGKSKHAIETATTVVKSTNSDGIKHTSTATATKTVKETTTGPSLIQKEIETKSLCVEETIAKTDNVAPTLAENEEKPTQVLKEDEKVKDSSLTEKAAPALEENAGKTGEVVQGVEKVNDVSPTDISNVVPASSKDDMVSTKVVKEDGEKRESTIKADITAKTGNVDPTEEDKMKESNQTKDNITKTEFMTPTSEDVGGPFEAVKGDEEVKGSKEDTITTTTSDEKPVKTTDGPSNRKDDNLKMEEQKLVVQASESTKVGAKKEEDVGLTGADIAKAKISTATETEKVPSTNGANTTETQEKKP